MIIRFFNKFIRKAEIERRKTIFPKSSNVEISDDFYMGNQYNINIPSIDIKLTIKPKVHFRQFCSITIFQNAELLIEENVFFNSYCSINCLGYIKIGSNTIFGEGVKMYDHNHQYENSIDQKLHVQRENFTIGSVKIGKNCWIGSNVTILNNVEIGDNVIVGANCLIYKSIPSNCIVKHNENLIIQTITE